MISKYRPALIIGAGGTGVRTLRFLRALAEQTPFDEHFKHMLHCSLIQMIGIDTDPSSNRDQEQIDGNLTRIFCEGLQGSEPIPGVLPTLPTITLCDPRTVSNAVKKMAAMNAASDGQGAPSDMQHILEWFPASGPGSIPPGQATSVAQFRPLGRLALFLETDTILGQLRRAYQTISQVNSSESDQIDAYIICSLGGGTGSGMFWDLAFFLKMIDPKIHTTGLFLMPEAYDAHNRSGKLYANTYAALKEIRHFKNWNKPFAVNYLTGDRFQARENDASALNLVMLYSAFPAGFLVNNRETATIDASCLRMAQNLLALQRKDLGGLLPGSLDEDSTSPTGSLQSGYVFCTSSCAAFPSPPTRQLQAYLCHQYKLRFDGTKLSPIESGVGLQRDLRVFFESLQPSSGEMDGWLQAWARELATYLREQLPGNFMHLCSRKLIPAALFETLNDLRGKLENEIDDMKHETLFLEWLQAFAKAEDGRYLKNEAIGLGETIIGFCLDWMNTRALLNRTGLGLRENLFRVRSTVFVDGVTENPLNQRRLSILPYTGRASREVGIHIRDNLEQQGQEVFGRAPHLELQATDTPIVFFLDLYRSAEEIARIDEYFQRYQKENLSTRSLFHIHRELGSLPEILGSVSSGAVFCGNPGCTQNIRGLAASTRFCPSCNQPIYNLCGNADCTAVNILEMIESQRGQRREANLEDRMPYYCPACEGWLENYWWKCPHHNRPNPIDKISCTTCMEEYQRQQRNLDKISRRSDFSLLTCHGCQHIETVPTERVLLPSGFNDYYWHGVNGHQTRVFNQLVVQQSSQYLNRRPIHFECPNSYQRHFLFPTCPEGRLDRNTQHHLYKTANGQFCCTRHPEIDFYTCFHCSYPVSETDLAHQSCPRCLYALKKCYFCSDRNRHFYTPLKKGSKEHCPNCTHLIEPPKPPFTVPVGGKGVYCPNIYGCRAASSLAACEPSLIHCKVCPEQAQLLSLESLKQSLENCPLCSKIFSISRASSKTDNGHELCRLCGCTATKIEEWEKGAEGSGSHKNPGLCFEAALRILKTLHTYSDEQVVFKKLAADLFALGHDDKMAQVLKILSDFFPDRSPVQSVIERRLESLQALYEQHHGSHFSWHTSPQSNVT